MVDWNNKDEVREYKRQHHKNYYPKNRERILASSKMFRETHKEYDLERKRIYRNENKKQIAKYKQEYRHTCSLELKNRIRARQYANNHKLKRLWCLLCLLEGYNTKAVAFHHTDYNNNLGFSVCKKHHTLADKWIKGVKNG